MTLEENYEALKTKLHDDTCMQSNPSTWLRHESYKKIVALGMEVVPLILKDIQKYLKTGVHEDYPGWWTMHALPQITGDRIKVGGPEVKVEQGFAKVSVEDVNRWWIAWGVKKGLLNE